ncbi:MAG TPA: GH3 auxin-responsive promoter family protein [Anaerolineales bacterium]
MKAYAANALWVASCLPEWRRFQRAAERVQETQTALLSRYLSSNKATEYGEQHHFSVITSPSRYQNQVPLTTYDDYVKHIARIGEGQRSVLTAEPVRMFELSSGSTAASKLVPYTDSLKAEFQRGIAPWIYDLYKNNPGLQYGPAYWSITPLMDGKRFTPAGIPIGFDSDSAYLGSLGKWLVDALMAVPNTVKNIANIDSFRYVTLLYMLRQPNLRLISVWNPTFLSLLLAPLPERWEGLLHDIELGTVSLADVDLSFTPKPELARALRALSPTDHELLWPHLSLISCWRDGPSRPYARQIEETFPHASLQGKGLLATEAFVSVPIVGIEGSVLSINSHFFEFIDEAGEPLLAHQIEKGKTYSVVITTGGGFYRYQLHDIVEVVGHWKQIPCIRFVGKEDHISDWFGEKLEERFVANTLEQVFAAHHISPAFFMLAPEDSAGFHYVLYVESNDCVDDLAKDLDDALRANFHYDYCRKLGQLETVQIVNVTRGAERYLHACQARGQKLGNIKPSVLQKQTGWKEWFEQERESAL